MSFSARQTAGPYPLRLGCSGGGGRCNICRHYCWNALACHWILIGAMASGLSSRGCASQKGGHFSTDYGPVATTGSGAIADSSPTGPGLTKKPGQQTSFGLGRIGRRGTEGGSGEDGMKCRCFCGEVVAYDIPIIYNLELGDVMRKIGNISSECTRGSIHNGMSDAVGNCN